MQQPRRPFLLALIAYAVIVKVMPFVLWHFGTDVTQFSAYPWSITPLFAIALVGTGLFRQQPLGFAIPLASNLVGDVVIGLLAMAKYGFSEGFAYAVYPGQPFVYLGLIACSACGLWIRRQPNWLTIVGSGFAAAALFFLVSNFGSWLFDTGLYTRDVSGLLTCYYAGLPFFRNSLVSTWLFSAILFSPIGLRHISTNEAGWNSHAPSTVRAS